MDSHEVNGKTGVVNVTILPNNATNKNFTVHIAGEGWKYNKMGFNEIEFQYEGYGDSTTATIESVDGRFTATVKLQPR